MKASGLYEVVGEEDPQEVVWRVFVDAVRNTGLTEKDLIHVSEGTLKALAHHAGFGANAVVLAKLVLQWRILREVGPGTAASPMPSQLLRSPVHASPAYSPLRANLSPLRTPTSATRSPLAYTPAHSRRTRSASPSHTSDADFMIGEIKKKACFSARKPLGDKRVARGISPEGGREGIRSGRRLERVEVPSLPPYQHRDMGDGGPPFGRPSSRSASQQMGCDTFDRCMTNHVQRTRISEVPKRGRAYSASPESRQAAVGRESRVRILNPHKKHESSLSLASVVITSPQSASPMSKRVGYAHRAKIYGTTTSILG